ncbi:MAG: mechanosensitive ion channel [Thermodesulfobacteriota bacterium]|nr:mechanosensitive ion channel [Thermodesulfobacteriota bacterium]
MEQLQGIFIQWGLGDTMAVIMVRGVAFIGMLILAYVADLITRHIVLKTVDRLVKHTRTDLDDILLRYKFFHRISQLAPAIVIYAMAPVVFFGYAPGIIITQKFAQIYMLLVGLLSVDAFLNAAIDGYQTFDFSRRIPIRGFIQVIKIVLYFLVGIMVLSIIIGRSPAFFFTGLGAMTAVLLIIFKDSILGFVAGIQLSTNQMVQIGDWIEMPQYGADGDVIDISLTTVKVQNFDKTIITLPAYSMIANSFKNWQGMSDSGGRRIKRAVYIDMTSIRFCSEEMLARFEKFQYISEYIKAKKGDIIEYNAVHQVDESEMVNGRHLTNIGTFRAYIVSYLRNHPRIHNDMTLMVRYLPLTERGLPLEIYCFSNDQVWTNYEEIQANIFDHILAIIPEFDLRVFQNPAGTDFQRIQANKSPSSQEIC